MTRTPVSSYTGSRLTGQMESGCWLGQPACRQIRARWLGQSEWLKQPGKVFSMIIRWATSPTPARLMYWVAFAFQCEGFFLIVWEYVIGPHRQRP